MITNTDQIELLPSLLPRQDNNYYYLDIAETTLSALTMETRIHDIQGTGLISPLEGTLVNGVAGIVTAIASNGFYFQDPNPDNNPQTSEGIFVFTGSRNISNIQVGDSVNVSGTVTEFQSGGSTTNNLTITVINNHLTSRGGRGTPLFGDTQPPIIGGDTERTAQAVVLNGEVNPHY